VARGGVKAASFLGMRTAFLSLSKIQWSQDKLKAAKGARSSGSGATSDSLDVVEAPAWWWPASSGPDLCFSSFFVMFAMRTRARCTTKTSLFVVRLQARRMAKQAAVVSNGALSGAFFTRAR
jgi:hypothetical protein